MAVGYHEKTNRKLNFLLVFLRLIFRYRYGKEKGFAILIPLDLGEESVYISFGIYSLIIQF